VNGSLPIEKVPVTNQPFYEGLKGTGASEIEFSSISLAIYADYRIQRFPDPKGPPPRLVVFPEFVHESKRGARP